MKLINSNNFGWPIDLFDNWFKVGFSNNELSMKTDIKDNDNDYEFLIELPGFNKEEIKVAFEDGYLTVTAKRENKVEDNNDKYVRRERIYGEYTRSFYIGEIDESKISANYIDGVLKLIVPKDEIEKAKAKKYISIN